VLLISRTPNTALAIHPSTPSPLLHPPPPRPMQSRFRIVSKRFSYVSRAQPFFGTPPSAEPHSRTVGCHALSPCSPLRPASPARLLARGAPPESHWSMRKPRIHPAPPSAWPLRPRNHAQTVALLFCIVLLAFSCAVELPARAWACRVRGQCARDASAALAILCPMRQPLLLIPLGRVAAPLCLQAWRFRSPTSA
jgi:hypothetical protein